VKKWTYRILILLFLTCPLPAYGGAPLDTVSANVGSVLEILRDPSLKGEKGIKVKKERIHAASLKLFDFVELSKRTLGLNWNKLTPDQRKEFVDLYRSLLEDAYIDKVTAYTDEQVKFTKEVSLSENTAEVQSFVITKSAEVPIYYRAIKKGNDWQVYDVVIEGVSLINNYRTQFREILGNNAPETLLDSLRKKAAKR
jgi:phospholipid transport system substrate-binding protein